MNSKTLALTLILALSFSLVAGAKIFQVANANFFPGDVFYISSPTSTTVYTNTSIPLTIVASVANPTPEVVSITYNLDNDPNVTITNLNKTLRPPGHIDGSQFYAESVLENLVEGNHTLKAYSLDASGEQMSASVEFTVDMDFKSPLSVLSPRNITYTTSDVPLIFVCSEEFTLSPDYMLDGMGMGPISGNLTLTGLSIGEHELTVTVWTVKGFFSETIRFSISQTPEPTPSPSPSPTASNSPEPTPTAEPFPTVLVAAASIGIIVAVAGLLVYFKKSHRNRDGKAQ